jgi:hypothetical protein
MCCFSFRVLYEPSVAIQVLNAHESLATIGHSTAGCDVCSPQHGGRLEMLGQLPSQDFEHGPGVLRFQELARGIRCRSGRVGIVRNFH